MLIWMLPSMWRKLTRLQLLSVRTHNVNEAGVGRISMRSSSPMVDGDYLQKNSATLR